MTEVSEELTEVPEETSVEVEKPKRKSRAKKEPEVIDMKARVKVKNTTNRTLEGIRPGDVGEVSEARARSWNKYLERV
jgi:hypothetical protein